MNIEDNGEQDDIIRLNHINTEEAAKNFAKLLNENKTYFLNARWGAGKTEFLNNVEKYTTINKRKGNKKFIVLDFWRVKDERSVLEISFSKLRPCIYWVTRTIMILSVVLSILMTDVVNIGLSSVIMSLGISESLYMLTMRLGSIISLFIAVWSFFKIKSDSFYINLLNNREFNKKVLIVDDFDRVNEKIQEELYKVFNLLENKIPIVFVGDFDKIAKNKDSYLQKIISKKIELPFDLHPSNIWKDYFGELEERFQTKIPDELKEVIIGEQRNLRERQQFNDYINYELFIRNKLKHVQPIHQMLVIYVYIFYPDYYDCLVTDNDFEFANEIQKIKEAHSNHIIPDYPTKIKLQFLLYNMQRKEHKGYPYPFNKNKQGYFLYEQPSNLKVQELDILIEDDDKLKEYMFSDVDTDFYQYIQENYEMLSENKKNKLLTIALILVKESYDSPMIRFILTEKSNEIMPRKIYMGNNSWAIPEERMNKSNEQINKEIYDSWHYILEKHKFDFTQELYLLEKYVRISFNDLGILFPKLEINEYIESSRKDFLLLTYISSKELWGEFSVWEENIWEFILSLSDEQYISFWTAQGILFNGEGFEFDIPDESKKYIIWLSKRNFDYPGERINNKEVILKIKPKLKELEKKGYTFIEEHEQ